MKPEIKKLLILNLPYLLFVYLFDKVGAAIRLSPGADASQKFLQLGTGFAAAFSSIAPSFHPADLLIGIAGAVIVRLVVYFKGKNAKKYRKGMEYGSARCRVDTPCNLIDVDPDFLYLCGHGFYIGMVYLYDVTVNGDFPKIRRHVPGRYQFHFFCNQIPFFL